MESTARQPVSGHATPGPGRVAALAAVLWAASGLAAAEQPFTGKFGGTGRACSGGLYVRTQTIEWNSSFSVCRPARYEVLEKTLNKDQSRVAFRFKTRNRQCLYEVVEAEQVGTYSWDVRGYQSLASYRNRSLPDWSNSPLPERLVLSCPMTRLD